MIDGRNVFDQPTKNDLKLMTTLEILQQDKVMIARQDAYQIIPI